MPDAPDHYRFGPVLLALLPHPPRTPAEAVARPWLAAVIGRPEVDLPLPRDVHGRPQLALPGLDANWSHSGDALAVALGAGVQVGIDIESPRPRPRAAELARRYFHPDEAAELQALSPGDCEAAFLRLWCAKEAVLKAHGRGLAFGLDRLRFRDLASVPRLVAVDAELGNPADWRIQPLAFDGLVGMVAWRQTLRGG